MKTFLRHLDILTVREEEADVLTGPGEVGAPSPCHPTHGLALGRVSHRQLHPHQAPRVRVAAGREEPAALVVALVGEGGAGRAGGAAVAGRGGLAGLEEVALGRLGRVEGEEGPVAAAGAVPAARLLRPRSSATTHVPAGSASGRRGGFNFRPPGRVHHPDEPDGHRGKEAAAASFPPGER